MTTDRAIAKDPSPGPNKAHHIRRATPDDAVAVENIVVRPTMRGRGLERALIAEIEKPAIAHHCIKLMLLSGTKGEAAHAFFRRCGFAANTKNAFVKYRRQFTET